MHAQHFTDKTRGVRRLGAAAVDLCHVAAGSVVDDVVGMLMMRMVVVAYNTDPTSIVLLIFLCFTYIKTMSSIPSTSPPPKKHPLPPPPKHTGMVDAYFEFRLKPWDTCAGVLMVEEAGGRVTTMDGRAYSVFERSLLASNDALYDALLKDIEPKTMEVLEQGADLSPWFIPNGYKVHTGAQLE